MRIEKTQYLKEKETLQAKNSRLEYTVVEACRTMSDLHILEDAQMEDKIRKLAIWVREENEEIQGVQFNFNMKIMEFHLKLQGSTAEPP